MLKDVKPGEMLSSTNPTKKVIEKYQSNTMCPLFESSMYIIYDGKKILLCDKNFKTIHDYNYQKNIYDACSIDDSVYVSTINEIIKLNKHSFVMQKSIKPK